MFTETTLLPPFANMAISVVGSDSAQVGRSPRRFERVSEHDAMQWVVAHTVLAERRQPGQRLFDGDIGRVPSAVFRHAQGQNRVAETGRSNGISARSRRLLFRLVLLIYCYYFALQSPTVQLFEMIGRWRQKTKCKIVFGAVKKVKCASPQPTAAPDLGSFRANYAVQVYS